MASSRRLPERAASPSKRSPELKIDVRDAAGRIRKAEIQRSDAARQTGERAIALPIRSLPVLALLDPYVARFRRQSEEQCAKRRGIERHQWRHVRQPAV